MSTTTNAELYERFRREGRAEGFPEPCANPWVNAAFDLTRAYNIRAKWLPRAQIEEAQALPGQMRIETPFPTDAITGTVCLHEVMHCVMAEQLRGLPRWLRETRVDEAPMNNIETRAEDGDFSADDVATAEDVRGKRLCGHLRRAIEEGETTSEEIRRECQRPSLLAWYGQWIGLDVETRRNGHRGEVDDDELRGLLAGPRY
jgi:hypothetical protein